MERSASWVSLRSGKQRTAVACAVLAGTFTGLVALSLAALAADPPNGSPLAVSVGFTVLFAGVSAACGRLAYRCATAGVEVSADHVVVRNPVTTVRLPTRDVVRFAVGRVGQSVASDASTGVLILTRDGRRVPAWALTGQGAAQTTSDLQRVADELNGKLAAARSLREDRESPTRTANVRETTP